MTKLIGIEQDEQESGGLIHLEVNNKQITVFVFDHIEADYDGPALSDEEYDSVLEFLNTSEQVLESFPIDD